jgi:hypothetical protein
MNMQNIGNCAQNVFCYIEWEHISMIVSLYQSVVSVYTRDKTESNDVQSHVPDLCTGIMQAQNSQSHPDRNTRHCAEKKNKDSSRLFLFWIQRERERCKVYAVFVLLFWEWQIYEITLLDDAWAQRERLPWALYTVPTQDTKKI